MYIGTCLLSVRKTLVVERIGGITGLLSGIIDAKKF